MTIDYSRLAQYYGEAEERAQVWAHTDPFPSVPCSLLSSAEIHEYVRVTGMLHPFNPDALKSASYEAHIGGSFIRWDEKGRRYERQINKGDRCILPANSITFVQVEPEFLLPDYIAIRFNLRITHVHRGLLLGTGPLVDPGFAGKLLIPLHNLTSSEYDIDTNSALIWIEFTKTTYGRGPSVQSLAAKPSEFIAFPPGKKKLTPNDYLRKASGGHPIRSSIPDALEQGRKAAVDAAGSAKQMRNLGVLALVALGLTLFGFYFQVANLVHGSINLSMAVQRSVGSLDANEKTTAASLQASQAATEHQIDQLRTELEQLKIKVRELEPKPPTPTKK